MTTVHDLERQRAQNAAQLPTTGVWAAIIATDAATVTDKVMVRIPGFNSDFQWGPCRWTPRVELRAVNVAEPGQAAHVSSAAESTHNIDVAYPVYPQRGDEALVAIDDNDDVWILVYWPAA